MVIRELFVKLGLDKDAASFAEGFATVELLKKGIETVEEMAVRAKEFLVEQVRMTAEAGEAARNLALQTGLSREAVQAYGDVAYLSGISQENLTTALRRFAKTGVKDVEAGLLKLADQFARMPDDGAKVKLAIEKFGRAGSQLIPMLNKGSEGVKEMLAAVRETGDIMGGEAIEHSLEYMESIRLLELTWRGFKKQAIEPVLVPLAKVAVWIQKHIRAFGKWVREGNHLKNTLKFLGIAILAVGAAFVIMGVAADAAAVGGLVPLLAIMALNTIAALEAAAAWLLAAAPLVLLAVLIGALLVVIEDFVTYLRGGDSLIGRAINKWKVHFKDFDTFVRDIMQPLGEWLEHTFERWIPGFKQAADLLAKGRDFAADKVGDFVFSHPWTQQASWSDTASSPTAAARSSSSSTSNRKNVVNTFAPKIDIHAAPNMSVEDVGNLLVPHIQTFFDGVTRDAAAGAT